MNKKLFLGAFLVVFAFTAYVFMHNQRNEIRHHYVFTGAGSFWSATYEVSATETFFERNKRTEYEQNNDKEFTLTYNRDISDLTELKELKYSYAGYAAGGSETVTFPSPPQTKVLARNSTTNRGGALERKDAKIDVIIEWNGNQESFTLTAK